MVPPRTGALISRGTFPSPGQDSAAITPRGQALSPSCTHPAVHVLRDGLAHRGAQQTSADWVGWGQPQEEPEFRALASGYAASGAPSPSLAGACAVHPQGGSCSRLSYRQCVPSPYHCALSFSLEWRYVTKWPMRVMRGIAVRQAQLLVKDLVMFV